MATPDLFQPLGRAVARGPLGLSALPIHSLRPGASAPPQPREQRRAGVAWTNQPGGGEEKRDHASARVGDRV